ncbi:tripartite tricarboxylate transporter permease [uncultured Sphaerochaeta sp.]|uniref:tripartite tricarboxylate transporter permease n=1 Tax=uncultured Sphaerochaeta sp. TaxID=886478 RepID=UPI002A0A6A6F|nr:tripartite tricarboxylate transporter permease [uncultured Sphaerochaeta sp.]
MDMFLGIISYASNLQFVLLVFAGSLAGLFVGSIPGLSVSMATALLVSITYSWQTTNALATIMGVYVVGVFSGALSAILINIPGAPSSVVTTLDGFPMAKKGEAYKALIYAVMYSFIGTLFGFLALAVVAKPISSVALKFTPMDYFLLATFGLTTVGSLTTKHFAKGLISACLGLFFSMVGIDSVMGTARLTFGIENLQAGINIVPALVGLFGFSEVLMVISTSLEGGDVNALSYQKLKMKEVLRHTPISLWYATIGVVIGALPGAGGPVAAFLAYSQAKKLVKNPAVPFGEGAVEGIVASESANNACIGGAMIPMLTLAIPGDAVTAIILSVFYVHGLQPGPMFIKTSAPMFHAILAGGFIGSVFLLVLGLLVAPRISKIIAVPKRILLPLVTILCIIGSFATNNRMFDVYLMLFFGVLGFFMRRRSYSVAPMTLAIVLGGMMDSNFRRAISLASSEDVFLVALLGRPITMILLTLVVLTLLSNSRALKRFIRLKRM